ncbi:MAG TPA: CDP-alcohol phosphatidyltransferase family protein [Gemmatimonadaceae bacterium]|nr:CDP-alcohol phosphatidyltransferase family protein [Gemmatimonadaceae bacterium]
MNLPNAITIGRIFAAPFVAWLPFSSSWALRLFGFVLFVVVAVSDYYDGMLARTRNLVTNLGKQLDPLADKLFLVATFVPMYVLMERRDGAPPAAFPFVTPMGEIGFPLWIALVILGRELLMTVFRQIAARRGVVIAAIGPAKWKTGFQLVWVGAAYFWFWAATAAAHFAWQGRAAWEAFARFNGIVGVVTMLAATALTVYSLLLYFQRYGGVLVRSRGRV